jgi:RimJ/RimL family protein N-acetyltransferase
MNDARRLTYEPLALVHADELFRVLDDPLVGRYTGGPDVTTLAAMRERIEFLSGGASPSDPDEKWVNVVARRLEDGQIVGRLEATVHGDRGELAYVFGPAWWGQGYATEGVLWLIDHLTHTFQLASLWACVHPHNVASQRLAQRVGLVPTDPPEPVPMSYDEGDLVFVLRLDQLG